MATTDTLSTRPAERPRLGIGSKLAYVLLLLGVLALGVSGIGTWALGHPPMTHWILMLHVGVSPLFSVGLALVAMTWPVRGSAQSSVSRFFLWLLLLAGLVVILSGVVPMTPIFGTEGQHLLYLVHRYGGIVVAATMLLHLLSLRPTR